MYTERKQTRAPAEWLWQFIVISIKIVIMLIHSLGTTFIRSLNRPSIHTNIFSLPRYQSTKHFKKKSNKKNND